MMSIHISGDFQCVITVWRNVSAALVTFVVVEVKNKCVGLPVLAVCSTHWAGSLRKRLDWTKGHKGQENQKAPSDSALGTMPQTCHQEKIHPETSTQRRPRRQKQKKLPLTELAQFVPPPPFGKSIPHTRFRRHNSGLTLTGRARP